MKYNPKIHHRRSIRLRGYDYSQAGLYFITICCENRECLFGEIVNGEMICNDAGKMINQIWNEIPVYYNGFNTHQFIVMPNHIHGIIEITAVGAGPRACPNKNGQPHNGQPQGVAPTIHGQPQGNGQPNKNGQPQGVAPTGLGDIVGRYKTLTTKKYIEGVENKNWRRFDKKIWQRNYWEHIVRDENEYQRISEYIINNPMKWDMDKLNGGRGNQVMEAPSPYGQNIFCLKDEAWMI